MRKLFAFIAICTTVLFAECSKSDGDTTPGTDNQLILGTWYLSAMEGWVKDGQYENEWDNYYSMSSTPYSTITFYEDGSYITNSKSSTFRLSGSLLTINSIANNDYEEVLVSDYFSVSELTETTLKMKRVYNDGVYSCYLDLELTKTTE